MDSNTGTTTTTESSSITLTVVLVIVSTLLIFLRRVFVRNVNKSNLPLPPCLPYLPLVGSLPFMTSSVNKFPEFFMKTADRMGSVFAFYGGSSYTIVLNGKASIETALSKRGSDFADRIPMYFEKHCSNINSKGIVSKSYDSQFTHCRKISLKILKDFGFGIKNLSEERIRMETESFVLHGKEFKGQPINPKQLIQSCVSNVMFSMLFGDRFDLGDPNLQKLIDGANIMADNALGVLEVVLLLRFLPYFKKKLDKLKNLQSWMDSIQREINTGLKSTMENFGKRFVEIEGDEYDQEQLLFIVRDFILGGVETSTTTLQWFLVMLANNRKIQETLQKEVDLVVPGHRLPSMEDKTHLPYVDASVLEIMRWKTVLPFAIPCATFLDTEVGGYFVPAGSRVITNLYSVHMSPDIWSNPEIYEPERFLDSDGKVYGRERIIPFSIGKRSCLGEVLAWQEIFLFCSAIVQQFDVLPPEGQQSVQVEEHLLVTLMPTPFEIRLIPRHV